ncbi:osmoprotectant ABC transporter permease protein YehY [Klebsiella pneumoniae]|uniref:Osmoprotectant ABC transporter permease protein YehY n=1 Tax=Klebsiella pneumoniae TaxID=573 RepID=A0A4P0YAY3_KLEPN|nr:osmoprotectant ABC transporter permease protein YehY [Klebsiella pneumoniae]
MTIRCTHRVGLLLTGLLLVTLALPFVTYAPNRLLSGEGRGLWQALPWLAGVQLAAALAGMLLCWLPGRIVPFLHLLLAELIFPLLIWGSGQAALELSRHGSPLARTSPGSGLWLSLALCLLLASEAIRHLTVRPLWRWLLNAQVWLLPIILLAIGALDQLSLLKEYANRQEVFDDALRQHLLLLFGTLLPGLLIGLPLGVWLWRRPRWQAPAFTALNVIQTIPSVALFGLLIAPLAGLARYFPTLGELGVSGTGVAPALIALTLYALLPLVRGVVTGLQQVPQDALESATAMGMSAGPALSSGAASAGDAGTAAQPAGGQRANRRHGGSGRADRRRRLWRAGFSGAAEQCAGSGAAGRGADHCPGGGGGCPVRPVGRLAKRRGQ